MNRVLLSLIGLLSCISGCASSSTVSSRDADHVVSPVQSTAPEETREFHIAAADVPTALNEFSRQANKQLLFDYVAIRERHTHGVEGTLPPSEALRDLLKDTGLIGDNVNEHTMAIMPDPSSRSIQH
jgi:hypothetical protein